MESKEYFEKVMLYFTEQLRSSQRGLCFTSSGLIPNLLSLGKFGIANGSHTGVVNSEVTLDGLFAK